MKYKIINTYLLSSAVVSALLTASSASAQNIFVANWYNPGAIYEFTPGSSPSTYYSGGLGEPEDIAFNSSGDLFVANSSGNAIDEITPGSDPTESSFASIPDRMVWPLTAREISILAGTTMATSMRSKQEPRQSPHLPPG